jgi:RND family efflux transporter MFP subunit
MAAKKSSFLPKLFVFLIVVAVGVFGIIQWTRPEALVAEVFRGRAVDAVPGSVVVEAGFIMDIKSEIGGRLIFTSLEPGKRFEEGEVLVRIDTGDIELEVQKLESDFAAARRRVQIGSSTTLELANAKDNLRNLERLADLGQISDNEIIQARRAVQQVEQRVALEAVANQNMLEGYENQLLVKRRQMDKMTVRAPFDGVVSEVIARPGDLIGGGSPIARLISTSRTVEARISEENFAGIAVGQKAAVRFLGYGDQLYDATVEQILPTADAETQRYVVYLRVEVDPVLLVPGITGEVSIVVGERDNTLIIPRRALFGSNVYVVTGGVVELRQVRTGFTSLNDVEITEGLTEGELVIVDRLDIFRAGDRINTVSATAN